MNVNMSEVNVVMSEMLICLLIALVVGFLFAWFLKGALENEEHEEEIEALHELLSKNERKHKSLSASYEQLVGEMEKTNTVLAKKEDSNISLKATVEEKERELDALNKVLQEVENTELDLDEKVVLENSEYDELLQELSKFKSSVASIDTVSKTKTKVYELTDKPALYQMLMGWVHKK